MSGAVNNYKQREKQIQDYIKKNEERIYHGKMMPSFDMRGYAKYIREQHLSADEITSDIMNKFVR